MEWTFRITEAQYLRAWNLERRIQCGAKKRLLLALIGVGVVLMTVFVVALVRSSNHEEPATESHRSSNSSAPIGGIAGVMAAIAAAASAAKVKRRYKTDAAMQGEFTVRLDGGSIAVSNSAAASWESGWSQFTGWREDIKRGLIVLRQQPRQFVVLNVSGLQELQRTELRALLAQALPPR